MEISAHGLIGHLGKGLAPREMQCLLYVAAGMTSKETARELGVSPNSVDKRLLSATTKLGVTRRAALVAEAFRRGLISFAPGALPSPSPNHPSQDRETINDVFVA
ncbi:helix-turn-helix transcriptional regulator [Pseudomonas coleopterorum]|uniref:Helix-turn-helix transcriptional regulator n=1 Tax=Pseudomonas coleopterorum TaxID=1605838 RepID=A0AAJ6M332_9PSED|nr:helix-turn-helix transcriptional regulator [Pseudomonas coleopterorum]WNC12053.1 helix-turn-helix transcriptional regulator [Pseudomonas coleopterorum]